MINPKWCKVSRIPHTRGPLAYNGTLRQTVACRTCCKQKQGSRTSNNFTCQTHPTKSYLFRNLSKQVTCNISGHEPRKAGSLPRARNGSPCCWLTDCGKCVKDSAHPRVLRSGTAIAGALRPQHTIGAADKRISWYTDCSPCHRLPIRRSSYQLSAPPTDEFLGIQSACPCQRLPIRGSPYQLSFPIRGSPYRARNQRRLWLFKSTHRRQILTIPIFMVKSTFFESIMMNR
jgi:hypothetical protein